VGEVGAEGRQAERGARGEVEEGEFGDGHFGGGGWDGWNCYCGEWVNAVLVGDQSEIARLYSIGKMRAASVRQTWLRNRVQAEGRLLGLGGIA